MKVMVLSLHIQTLMVFLFSLLKGCLMLECYTCEMEHHNSHCFTVTECSEIYDTCQTLVTFSDVSRKLSIVKSCTKNESCQLHRQSSSCDLSKEPWRCTSCCYEDICNVNTGHSIQTFGLVFFLWITSVCLLVT